MPKPTPTTTRTSRPVASTRASGMSVWSAFSINAAGLITALLVSISIGNLGWPFLLCYGIVGIITTLLVRLGGLFINVTSMPIMFGLVTPLTAWWIARSNLSGGADEWSKTMVLSALYPLAQFFPAFAAITVATIVLAVIRWRSAKANYEQEVQLLERQRRRAAQSEKQNRQTTTRVRQMSRRPRRTEDPSAERVPFSELIKDVNSRADRRRAERGHARKMRVEKRDRPRTDAGRPTKRRFDEDLYS